MEYSIFHNQKTFGIRNVSLVPVILITFFIGILLFFHGSMLYYI
jgi:hypothetical protein